MTTTEPRAPRVVIVTASIPPAYGGGALRAYRYAVRLHREGRLAFVLTQPPPTDRDPTEAIELPPDDRVPASKVRFVARAAGRQPGSIVRASLAYGSSQLRHAAAIATSLARPLADYDLVHCFGPAYLCLYSVAAARALGKRAVLEMTLLGLDDPRSILEGDRFRARGALRHFLYMRATAFVSKSPALTRAALDAGLPRARLWEVPNAVDVDRFRPASREEQAALRQRLGIPTDRRVLLFVGVVTRRKGVDTLIDAFARLDPSVRATLLLVGPTGKNEENRAFAAEMRRSAATLGVEANVRFVGIASNVEDYMRASDLLVFPSRREGFPNVVVEAMASGLPVVMSDIPGISDHIISSGEDGLIVPSDDPAALARAIAEVAGNDDRLRAMALAARRTVTERYSPHSVDASYLAIYDELLSA